MSTEDKPRIKFMSVADGDKHEQVLHKEVVIDMNKNSEIDKLANFHSKNDNISIQIFATKVP